MRRWIAWLMIMGSMTLYIGTVISEDVRLMVVDTQPLHGEQLALDAPITLFFDQAVDCAAAQAAFTLTPETPGEITCAADDLSLTFVPTEAYQRGTTYTFTLSTNPLGLDGASLEAPFTLAFTTVGFLRVTEMLPAPDAENVPVDSTITVLFDRPVVPLLTSVDMTTLPHPLTITPAVEGVGVWLNTSSYIFRPAQRLLPFVRYTVRLEAGLTGVDGALLADPVNWTFQTVQPKVLSVNPRDDTRDLLLDPRQTIYFNMSVDREMVETYLFLRPSQDSDTLIPLSFEWGEDSTYVYIRPRERLQLATRYHVGLDTAGLLAASYPFSGLTRWSFTTVPLPSITEVSPQDGAQGVRHGGFTIKFATPMDEESLRGKFTIEPSPDSVWEYYRYKEYVVSFPAQWETTYTVTSAGGFKDLYGNPVADDVFSVTYTTASPPPGAGLHAPYVGFHDAYRDDIGLYVTTRNIEQVDFALYNVPVKKFVEALLEREGYVDSAGFHLNAYRRRQWSFEPPAQSRGNTPQYVSLSQGEGALPRGVYFFTMTVARPEPEPSQRPVTHYHFALVQTANLTVKSTRNQVMIWATDVKTGLPIPDARIQVYQREEGLIAAGRTDADGLLVLDTPSVPDMLEFPRVAVLESADHFGIGTSYWANGIDPGHFNTFANYWPESYRFHIYTDRSVYRPAQKVYFRAVIRAVDDMRFTPPSVQSLPVRIQNSKGETIFERELPVTPFGTLSGELELDSAAPLGYYSILVTSPDGNNHWSGGGYYRFMVAEYRQPEFRVSVRPQRTDVAQGEVIQTLVEAGYFSGGAVSDGQVRYSVISSPYHFFYTGSEEGYTFHDPWMDQHDAHTERYTQTIAEGQAVTDVSGQARIEIPAQLSKTGYSRIYTIEGVVSDQTQQVVANRADVVVHASAIYLGARVDKYVVRAGEAVDFGLIAVDWDSLPISSQPVSVEVIKRRWYSVQEVDGQGRTAWRWETEDIPITEGEVVTGDDGAAAFSFTPERGGLYMARITTRDPHGHLSRAGISVWVSDAAYVAWPRANNQRVELIADQEEYRVGETAAVLITSPFQGSAEALITIERGSWLHVERVTLTSSAYLYEFPVLPEYAPNVFVSVMIVKGVDETNPVADFRMGLLQLKVDTGQKLIHLDIRADRERAMPGDTVRYTITATDHAGQPVRAEVGVALTDLASLSVLRENTKTLLETFYRLGGIGVRTATPLTVNTDRITQNIFDVVKGGGGGGEVGIIELREEFVDTPYWNAGLVTDDAGAVTFEIMLPDNLTTWRLDARAVTSGEDGLTLVGEATADLLSTLPLIVRPVTPRFLVVDDTLTLAAVVNNNTDETLMVDVALEADGVTLLHGARPVQRITAPANGRVRVEWPVRVGNVETVEIIMSARDTSGRFADAARPLTGREGDRLLPVYRYEVPETVASAGALRAAGARTEAVLLPRRFAVTEGELMLNIQPSLAATTLDGLRYLRAFPHECIEQTISRFLPNIITYRALVSLQLNNADLAEMLDQSTTRSLQRLNAQQRADGGWGWFYNEQSNPLTTAYALIGLYEAQEQGFPVPAQTISRAQDYLKTQHIIPSLQVEVWQMNREAFILYALARSGQPDIARAANLFEYYELLNLDARAYLLMTLHLNDPDDPRIETLTADLISRAVVSATGTHWDEHGRDYWNWTTSTRSTALILSALLMTRPDSDLLPSVVRWLVFKREKTAWATTQETAWAVMALTDWMVITRELQPGYTFNIALNGERLAQQAVAPPDVRETYTLSVQVGDLLADEINRLVIARDAGDGALYYTSYLRLLLPVPEVEPLTRGVVIDRRYVQVNGDELTEISEAQVGDVVQVRLTLVAPDALHYLMIDDPLPAGAEAINPNLSIGQQIGTRPSFDRLDPFTYGWNWWWFSHVEFRDARVNLYATYLPAGTYEYVYYIRAGIPGTYNVIPPTAQEFYFPEVYGRGAGSLFTIQPAAQ